MRNTFALAKDISKEIKHVHDYIKITAMLNKLKHYAVAEKHPLRNELCNLVTRIERNPAEVSLEELNRVVDCLALNHNVPGLAKVLANAALDTLVKGGDGTYRIRLDNLYAIYDHALTSGNVFATTLGQFIDNIDGHYELIYGVTPDMVKESLEVVTGRKID